MELTPYLKPYLENVVSCDKLIKLLPDLIYKFAKDSKLESKIGGPLTIIKITQDNNLTWIQNNFISNQPKNYNNVIELMEKGLIKLIPVVKDGVNKAIHAMKLNKKYKR